MGLNDILNTARDALAAQTFGLQVTGQNVANVNTPGYVRRQAQLETRTFGDRSFGSVGIAGVRRVADEFTNQRQLQLTGLSSSAGERDQLLGSVESLFNDFDGTGLSDSLNNLFSSFAAMSAQPTDPTVRATVVENASAFAQRLRETNAGMQSLRTEMFERAQGLTDDINLKTDAIADLSGKINAAQAVGADASDLLDRRDALLGELAQKIDVRTFYDGNGQLVVHSAGTTLVEGDQARHISLDLNPGGSVRVLSENGGEITKFLSGGELAGVIEVRDHDITQAQSDLDQFAFDITTAINGQHAQGFGLDGSTGQNLFNVTATASGAAASLTVDAGIAADPNRLAASSSAAAVPGDAGNALLLARIAEQPVSGVLTPGQAYSRLVGQVAARKAEAEQTVSTREAMTAQIEQVKESISGVSLDEEMVNLTKFQRAFEAASRVLTTADELLEDLINTLGR
jgi:flagellar hook-associated protein 1 FlgK